MAKLTIGTRASPLALWQAAHVQKILKDKLSIESKIKKITTKGDQILDRSLVDVGGKGLFLKEIEEELLKGTIDIAVHSMKDVPHTLDEGLMIAAILEREDPSDAFVSRKYASISEMPEGSLVGTSSLRRLVQLKQRRSDLKFEVLRGNVDTRIKKLEADQYDAIILASAGLIRLGLSQEIKERLPIVPGVGQGALGIECRADSRARVRARHESSEEMVEEDLVALLKRIEHEPTRRAIDLERYFAKRVNASCQMAVGCWVSPLAPLGRGSGRGGDTDFQIDCFWEKDGKYVREKRTGRWKEGEKIIDQIVSSRT